MKKNTIIVIAIVVFVAVAAILLGVFGVFSPAKTSEISVEESVVDTVEILDTVVLEEAPEETPCVNG